MPYADGHVLEEREDVLFRGGFWEMYRRLDVFGERWRVQVVHCGSESFDQIAAVGRVGQKGRIDQEQRCEVRPLGTGQG